MPCRVDDVEAPPDAVEARAPHHRSTHAGGPASKGNFTTFDDDGWWDDDENYWDDDYDWENYDSADDDAPHATARKSVRRRFHVDVDFTQARGLHQVDAQPEIQS